MNLLRFFKSFMWTSSHALPNHPLARLICHLEQPLGGRVLELDFAHGVLYLRRLGLLCFQAFFEEVGVERGIGGAQAS